MVLTEEQVHGLRTSVLSSSGLNNLRGSVRAFVEAIEPRLVTNYLLEQYILRGLVIPFMQTEQISWEEAMSINDLTSVNIDEICQELGKTQAGRDYATAIETSADAIVKRLTNKEEGMSPNLLGIMMDMVGREEVYLSSDTYGSSAAIAARRRNVTALNVIVRHEN